MYRVFDALLGRPERDWSAEYLALSAPSAQPSDPPRKAGTRPSLLMERYAGTYSDSLYGDLRVVAEPGGLVLYYSPDYVADLEHWHHDVYRATWRSTGFGSTFARFSVNKRGEVDSMTLDGFTTFSPSVSPSPHAR
jgi:hypothetical protein